MENRYQLPIITLLMMISFASVNAVLFTPALPAITSFFATDSTHTQMTLTYYLLGYTFGQLLYGPLANRYGRKPTLYIGIMIAVLSSMLCVLAGTLHQFNLLVLGRFLLALGAGSGLKMTFTLVNECYSPKKASQTIASLVMAFAISPGLGVALGGWLTAHFGWQSCFYASIVYSFILLVAVSFLPETLSKKNYNALKLPHLLEAYGHQFKHGQLLISGLLMGCCTAFIYMFAASAPFVAIEMLGMNSTQYGIANILPACGIFFGSLYAALLPKRYQLIQIMRKGIIWATIATIAMFISSLYLHSPWYILFIPAAFINFGLCLIIANASTIGLNKVADKSHGSAVLSFINMGSATVAVIVLSYFPITILLLPGFYIATCLLMILLYRGIAFEERE